MPEESVDTDPALDHSDCDARLRITVSWTEPSPAGQLAVPETLNFVPHTPAAGDTEIEMAVSVAQVPGALAVVVGLTETLALALGVAEEVGVPVGKVTVGNGSAGAAAGRFAGCAPRGSGGRVTPPPEL